MNRANAIHCHANRRALERYGVVVDVAFDRRLRRLIRRRLKSPKEHDDFWILSRSTRHRVTVLAILDGRQYRVAYEPATDAIVTYLGGPNGEPVT